MSTPHSDALVFFGVTGDLAYKKIFSTLLAMVLRDGLELPIIDLAHSGWNTERLRARAHDSVTEAAQIEGGSVDEAAVAKLSSRLHYLDGDHADHADLGTFVQLKAALVTSDAALRRRGPWLTPCSGNGRRRSLTRRAVGPLLRPRTASQARAAGTTRKPTPATPC